MMALSSSLTSPLRLLLVEHDTDVRALLHTFLTREGCAISLATAPPEALALLGESSFHRNYSVA